MSVLCELKVLCGYYSSQLHEKVKVRKSLDSGDHSRAAMLEIHQMDTKVYFSFSLYVLFFLSLIYSSFL